MYWRWINVLLIGWLGLGSLQAQRGVDAPVQPHVYKAAAGDFEWLVDPSDLEGKGSAEYVVRQRGKEVWRGQKDFTFYDAAVTRSGKLVGYGYTMGIDSPYDNLGEFKVAIVDTDGRVIVEEGEKRVTSRFLHFSPNPIGNGIEIEEDEDRVTICVADEDVNKRREHLWSYRISTGKKLPVQTQRAKRWEQSRQDERLAAGFKIADAPVRELKVIRQVELKGVSGAPAPLENALDFRIDGEGRIGAIQQRDAGAFRFVLVAESGKPLFETELPITGAWAKGFAPKLAWLKGNRWVVIASDLGEEGKAKAWWVDVDNRKVTEIAGFESYSVEQVASDHAGGFVVLSERRQKNSNQEQFARFDEAGRVVWKKRQDGYSGAEDELLGVEDLTVTSNGEVAMLSNVRDAIQYFALDGKYLRTLDLEKLWGREPSYPSEIWADFGGGIVVYDFNGKPAIVKMDAKGAVRAQFDPQYRDGRKIDPSTGIDVTQQGLVWINDGETISKLGQDGSVELSLGAAPDAEALTRVETLTVSDEGRIYVVDKRTGSVHVFDSTGSRVRVCKPAINDFDGDIGSARIAVTPTGEIFLSEEHSDAGHLHFDRNGQRVGKKEFEIDAVNEALYARADGTFLMLGYRHAFLLDSEGKAVRKISRRADGNWLFRVDEAAVAADGTFAIVSEPGFFSEKDWPVTIFSKTGEPIETFVVPAACHFVAWTGRQLLTMTEHELVAIDRKGGPSWRSKLDAAWKSGMIFAPFGGKEIWLAGKTILRMEFPE